MKTNRDINKIRAVVQYITAKMGGTVDFMKLFKLMYYAQQKSLVNMGRVLFDENFYAIKYGPVPSFTYKAFQYQLENITDNESINTFLKDFKIYKKENIGYVSFCREIETDWLSGVDKKYLDEIIDTLATKDSIELSIETHNDDAWKKAKRRSKLDPEKNIMSRIDIAKSGGASLEMLDYIREKQIVEQSL